MTKNIIYFNSLSFKYHVFVTILALMLTILIFESTNTDLWVQQYLYNFDTSNWLIDRDAMLMKFLFYDGIKVLYFVMVIMLIVLLIFFRDKRFLFGYRSGMLTMLLSMILVPLFVGWLKKMTNIPCPNDLAIFNGNYPYVTLFSFYPIDFHQVDKVLCYPAGHASGGFALMSIYFIFKSRTVKMAALFLVLVVGWSVGFYKMAIGDHFLSHTIISMLIAWLFAITINHIIINISYRNLIILNKMSAGINPALR